MKTTFRQFLEGWGAPDVTDFKHGYALTSKGGKYTATKDKKPIHDGVLHTISDAHKVMRDHAAAQGLNL